MCYFYLVSFFATRSEINDLLLFQIKEEFTFDLKVLLLSLLCVEVHEYDISEKDDFAGQTVFLCRSFSLGPTRWRSATARGRAGCREGATCTYCHRTTPKLWLWMTSPGAYLDAEVVYSGFRI